MELWLSAMSTVESTLAYRLHQPRAQAMVSVFSLIQGTATFLLRQLRVRLRMSTVNLHILLTR